MTKVKPPVLAALAAAFLLSGTAPALAGPCAPTFRTIALDGDQGDWLAALGNPLNSFLDDDGSSFSCSETSDRDCRVPNRVADLRRLAYTWDEANLYLRVSTQASTGTEADYFILIDRGDDGSFDGAALPGGDMVLRLRVTDAASEFDVEADLLHLSSPASHPMSDAASASCGADGLSPCGDGWAVLDGTGTFDTLVTYPPCLADCFDISVLAVEFAVPWADLDLPPGSPLGLHVSTDADDPVVDGRFQDNMGGDFRGAASTGFYCHELLPDGTTHHSTATGVARFPHLARNLGNLSDTYSLAAESVHGWTLELFSDPDGDGDPVDGTLLARDANGDGDYLDPADLVTAAGDSDGDGLPDTSLLAGGNGLTPGAEFAFVLELRAPDGLDCVEDLVRVDVVSDRTGRRHSAIDVSAAAGLALFPATLEVIATDASDLTARHALRLANGGAGAVDVSLGAVSASGWSTALLEDLDCDGIADGGPVPSPRSVPGATESCLVLEVSVPPGLAAGTEDAVTVQATVAGSPVCDLVARTQVVERLTLTPSYLLADGAAQVSRPNGSVRYRHLLTNSHDLPDAYTLSTIVSEFGFAAAIFTDPNGDGSPDDGESLGANGRTPLIDGGGGSLPLIVQVTAGALAPGTVNSTTLIAIPDTVPAATASLIDDTLIGNTSTFADPEHARAATLFWPCETVHVRASDLVRRGEREYLFEWRDPAGTLARSLVASSDELTVAVDARAFTSSDLEGTWTITLNSCSRGYDAAGVCLDAPLFISTTEFRLLAPARVDSLATERAGHAVAGDSVTVKSVLLNEDAVRELPSSVLEYRILTPDRTQYLRADGSFAPYTGTEFSRRLDGVVLSPGGALDDGFTISEVTFPAPGVDYRLELDWSRPCGAALSDASAVFAVEDSPGVETRCADGLDDDGDGDVDCDDSDRTGDPACGFGLLVNRQVELLPGGPLPSVASQCACPQPTTVLCADTVVPGPLAGLSLPGEAALSGQDSLWLYQHLDPTQTLRVAKAGTDLLFSDN